MTRPVFLSNFYHVFADRITVSRVAILGMLLAMLVAIKYAFGFVPGVEAVTFIFIVYALFLPPLDLILMVIAFNLIVNMMYGWGTWFLIYWIVWPIDIIAARLVSHFTRSRFIMAGFAFVAGFSLIFWYFLSDWLFFGLNFAYLNVFSALPISLIEGFATVFLVILVAPSLLRLVSMFRASFWPHQRAYSFKSFNIRWKNWFRFFTAFSAVASAGGIATIFVFNSVFYELRTQYVSAMPPLRLLENRTSAPPGFFPVQGYRVLEPSEFNQFIEPPTNNDQSLPGARPLKTGEVAVVVIANGVKYIEIGTPSSVSYSMYDFISNLKTLEFNFTRSNLGTLVGSFRLKGETAWRHGTNSLQLYDDFFAILAGNGYFLQASVSDTKVYGEYDAAADFRTIFELSYDV